MSSEPAQLPRIVIVSASHAEKSRSRLACLYAQECLLAYPVTVDFVDLQEYKISHYPHSENDPEFKALIERFNTADAWVLAVPIYNWGPSGALINFLHYALNDDPLRRFRPFVLLGGAGGQRSYLALDGLARTLIHEVCAVQVGPPIMAAGALVDRATDTIAPELQERIQAFMAALVRFAAAVPLRTKAAVEA